MLSSATVSFNRFKKFGIALLTLFQVGIKGVSIGLRIYKTVLSDEGYKNMTQSITESYDEIQKFEDTTLH